MVAKNEQPIIFSHEYQPLKKADIEIPFIHPSSVPVFTAESVLPYIKEMKTNKSTVDGDIPARILKECAEEISHQFVHLLNTMIIRGEYPKLWKHEIQTSIPKTHPPTSVNQL